MYLYSALMPLHKDDTNSRHLTTSLAPVGTSMTTQQLGDAVRVLPRVVDCCCGGGGDDTLIRCCYNGSLRVGASVCCTLTHHSHHTQKTVTTHGGLSNLFSFFVCVKGRITQNEDNVEVEH